MKTLLPFFVLLISMTLSAQIKGKVVNKNGEPVAFANISIKGTGAVTASNVNGLYSLNHNKKGEATIIYRAIGYKTKTLSADITGAYNGNVTLEEEEFKNGLEYNANEIIKNAIRNKYVNTDKVIKYKADFYSRGIFRIKETPDKILGQDVAELAQALNESGEGIVYLSETVSKLQSYKGKINEHIIASRLSGDNSGISFNNAASANFDLYNNTLSFDTNAISPLASYALSYYIYTIESTFTDMGQFIYKIKVTPKRQSEPAFDGYIYIADKSWALTAADLIISGDKIGEPLLDALAIKQNYGYDPETGTWLKNVQAIEFGADIMGIGYAGRFSCVYSNYNLSPDFVKTGNKVLSFEDNANNTTESYWNSIRQVTLTTAESRDYKIKDRINQLELTENYSDSIDRNRNRVKWLSPILGYSWHNSYDNWSIRYSGIATRLGYNTVQGYNLAPEFYFTRNSPARTSTTIIAFKPNYGFAEQRFRATGSISHKFNSFNNRTLVLSGGSSIEQFNSEKPINRIVNTIATLFFRENYMKVYDKNFIRLDYSEEVTNGVQVGAGIEYARRHSLFNNSNFSTLKDASKFFTSNNPLLPNEEYTPAFESHHIAKASVGTRITLSQDYRLRPDGKENLPTPYPRIYLNYEKGFAATVSKYNFDHLSGRITYDATLGNKGDLGINIKAGKFFNSDSIAFTDYKHFNGNQAHIGTSARYLNNFNLLPYYSHSTNDTYFETHLEHNFKGFIANKIPLFNKLDYHFVVGYHFLAVPQRSPYHEVSIGLDNVGWGRFRYLRLDYVRSFESGFRTDGIVFGLEFLDIFE